MRVSAPVTGHGPPVVLLAHGFGSSLDGYGPLADHWAAHGFVVVQPTHLDSRTVGLAEDDPRRPGSWRSRVEDMRRVLDDLHVVEAAVHGLAGRLNRSRVAAAGHSFGGQTAGILLGLRVRDPATGEAEARNTSSATSPATRSRRPPTRTPPTSPWSNGSPWPTSATPSASTAPDGRRRAATSPGTRIPSGGSSPRGFPTDRPSVRRRRAGQRPFSGHRFTALSPVAG
ncbi:alpha/beta hydrolase family protein [Streptomyces tendae]|uniref:alpha/beta hydrolase family protein n=1 Tax=Streptomyces tendae TaxID=1932 RepID=UPI0037131781